MRKYWLHCLSYIIPGVLGILNSIQLNINTDISNAINISFPISVALSFAFNITANLSYSKTINKLTTDNRSFELSIKNYEVQLQNINTLNNYYNIDFELPTLAISHVPYTITPSLLPFFKISDDAVQYISPNIVEVEGSTYYCYINDRNVLFSLNKEKIIQDYYKETMETIELQNGEGLVNKPRHLVVFKIINVSNKSVLSMMPRIIIDGVINKYKGVAPYVMKPNDELLFVVLVELYGQKENYYSFEFVFNYKEKQYVQKFPLKLHGENLSYDVLLKEPKELPPTTSNI